MTTRRDIWPGCLTDQELAAEIEHHRLEPDLHPISLGMLLDEAEERARARGIREALDSQGRPTCLFYTRVNNGGE